MASIDSPKLKLFSKARALGISPSFIFWAGLVIITVLAVLVRLDRVTGLRVSYDEAIHMIWLRLLAEGFAPYTEVYITYPPLYHLSIQAVWNIWPTQIAQRWFSVGYAVFGAVGTALLARKIAGTVAGIVAAALVLLSPYLLKPSQEIMGEFHSVSWSVWAVWSILLYQEASAPRQKWLFLILSGIFLSVSLLIKLLSPFILLLILLLIGLSHKQEIFTSPRDFKPLIFEVAVWGAALVLPAILLMFVLFDTASLFQQVIDQRFLARTAYLVDGPALTPAYAYAWAFFIKDKALVVTALIGLVITRIYYRQYFGVLLAWLFLTGLFLAVHTPLRPKHFLTLIPVLAILGAIGISKWATNLSQRPISLAGIGGLVLFLGLGFGQVAAIADFREDIPEDPAFSDNEQKILTFIEQVTAPEDCIITDHTPILYWSGRMTPPELAEMSGNRLISGALSTEELIAITKKYDCPLVAPVAHRLTQFIPDYVRWAEANYLGKVYYGNEPMFFGKSNSRPQPAVALQADFDGKIKFLGYSLPEQPIAAGERVPLRLIWEGRIPLEIDYTFFVQLRDEQGATLVSGDYQPYQTLLPTSMWPTGQPIETVTWLQLPENLPAGDYNIYIGIYRQDTLGRLPLQADSSGENALIIGPLQVR